MNKTEKRKVYTKSGYSFIIVMDRDIYDFTFKIDSIIFGKRQICTHY